MQNPNQCQDKECGIPAEGGVFDAIDGTDTRK
jgi:hypothetical protein